MIDLSKLQAGETVHFRCGGQAVVNRMYLNEGNTVEIKFSAVDRWMHLGIEGYWNTSKDKHPFDIIRIEPKPFDWKDVKPGMCFTNSIDKSFVWFIAWHFETESFNKSKPKLAVVQDYKSARDADSRIKVISRGWLKPAPEHDIEVDHA